RSTECIGPKLSHHVSNDQRRHTDHQSGVDPVVEVTRPTDDELCDSSKPVRMRLTQKRLFCEEVRRSRSWIQLRQFGICNCGCQAKYESAQNTEPHALRCHRSAIGGLNKESQPQESARSDQRHGI